MTANAIEGSYVVTATALWASDPVTIALIQYGPRRLSISLAGTGSGTVSSPAGIACGGAPQGDACAADIAYGTLVTLTAVADSASVFGGWGGACADMAPTCQVTMDQVRAVSATFTRQHRVFLPIIVR